MRLQHHSDVCKHAAGSVWSLKSIPVIIQRRIICTITVSIRRGLDSAPPSSPREPAFTSPYSLFVFPLPRLPLFPTWMVFLIYTFIPADEQAVSDDGWTAHLTPRGNSLIVIGCGAGVAIVLLRRLQEAFSSANHLHCD